MRRKSGLYGETVYDQHNQPQKKSGWMGWDQFYDYPPEHYGWVVEVDQKSEESSKAHCFGAFLSRMLYNLRIRRQARSSLHRRR